MSTVSYPHIEIDAEGIPWVAGTRIKVVEIVLDRLAYNWDVDEMQRQHPHLSLSQIHSALAYYYDHQTDIDEDIQRRERYVEEVYEKLGDSDLRRRLSALRRNS